MSGIRPRLRPLEVVPEGRGDDARMVLRDRDGWTPPVALPPGAVLLASLMDGTRTLSEIQNDYLALAGLYWPLDDLEQLVRRLDSAFLLDNARFQEFRRPEVQAFLRSRTRPAVGAGVAYPADRFELVSRLDALLGGNRNRVCDGARQSARRLRGVASPAGALSDGNAAYAAAFRRLSEESDADLFVILAACRRPMREPFCLLSKDFETPLGRTSVDRDWIDAFAGHYAALRCASREPLFHDALRHRTETAIELQTVLLQHVFAGPRDFRIVPILLGDLTPAPS
ncbi:MAG TPA: AmmeMemoRadiSam system protein B, partial [Pirellulales bacterium]